VAELRLETERLVLRHARPEDLDVWLYDLNSPAVMARLGGVKSIEDVTAAFARMLDNGADGELPFLVVTLKSDGTALGKCGLARISETGAPRELAGDVQIGWSLSADHWGRGYAREAAESILAHAFAHLGLPTVYGQTSASNTPSWGLMRRLGMTRVAELDYADPDFPPEDNPTMVWRLDRATWENAAAKAAAHV
jgi:RimJ/RimL family protein N-acetyltransferase